MEKSFIFNSINGDRKMKAEDFREYFIPFISNGVYPNPSSKLQVISNTGMSIILQEGKAFINGALYINTENLILTLDHADGALDRIDRIVLRMDTIERNIKCIVKKGQYASSPVAPSLQRDADAYELCIAEILVSKGTIEIHQSNISDTRLNSEICGIVTGLIKEIDTTTLYNQLKADIEKKGLSMGEWIKEAKEFFTNDFNTWFDTIKGALGEDIAGNLLNRIVELENTVNNLELTSTKVMRPDGSSVETSILEHEKEIEDLKRSGVNAKSGMKNAINSKVTVPDVTDSDNWDTYIQRVKDIKEGRGNAQVGNVLSGKTFTNDTGNLLTGTMTSQGSHTMPINVAVDSYNVYARIPQGGYVTNGPASYPEIQISNSLLNSVGFVKGGKRFASGTGSTNASSPPTLIVRGLNFRPSRITIVTDERNSGNSSFAKYSTTYDKKFNDYSAIIWIGGSPYIASVCKIYDDGFELSRNFSSGTVSYFSWEAYE